MSKIEELATKCTYDIGDTFYEPVAEIVQGSHGLEIEALARKHIIQSIKIDSRSWSNKPVEYYGGMGKINTVDWFLDEREAKAAAKQTGISLVGKEIEDEEYKVIKATKTIEELSKILGGER